MGESERRHCQRYQLNYPIIVSSVRALDRPEGWHAGEVLDAGKNGIRLRIEGFGALDVGTELRLVCQPVRDNQPNNKCMPVAIQGRVVWEDKQSNQFALIYTH